MAIFDNNKPILKQFRQAARSCNEWRDTLYYTGVGCLAVSATQWNLGLSAHEILLFTSQREFIRFTAWSSTWGRFSKEPGNFKFSQAVTFMTFSLDLAGSVATGLEQHDLPGYLTSHPLDTTALLVLSAVSYVAAGGIKNIYASYRDTLFDYPRKKNPPPRPRKKPVLEKFKAAWQGLKDKVGGPLPEGAFAPIPIRKVDACRRPSSAPTITA